MELGFLEQESQFSEQSVFSPGFFGNVTEIQLREFQKYNQECEINTHEKFGKYSFKATEEEREKAEVTFPEWSVNLSG